MKTVIIKNVYILAIYFLFTISCYAENVVHSPYSMDFYGYMPTAKIGDTIRVIDPDGTVCGFFNVEKQGKYGFLHVYGDDPSTETDEGAEMNDELVFMLNDKIVEGQNIVWTGDKTRKRIDF